MRGTSTSLSILSSDSTLKQRITREGRVWSKMKHKNILPLIGFWKSFLPGTESVSLSFITLWLDDGDLLRYLKAHPEVDCAQRLKYVSFDFIDHQR